MKQKYMERLKEYEYFADRMRYHPVNFNSNMSMFGETLSSDDGGHPAAYCLWKYESTGKMVPCKEADRFMYLFRGKGARDWHVSEWGSGMAEGTLTWRELQRDGIPSRLIDAAIAARDGFTRRKMRESSACC